MNSNQPSIFTTIKVEDKTDLQSIFYRVKNHLLTQRVPAKRPTYNNGPDYACAYRGSNGTKCAVGCLIADEYYDSTFEGTTIIANNGTGTRLRLALEKSGIPCAGIQNLETLALLRELQSLHDGNNSEYEYLSWEDGLKKIAGNFQLKY